MKNLIKSLLLFLNTYLIQFLTMLLYLFFLLQSNNGDQQLTIKKMGQSSHLLNLSILNLFIIIIIYGSIYYKKCKEKFHIEFQNQNFTKIAKKIGYAFLFVILAQYAISFFAPCVYALFPEWIKQYEELLKTLNIQNERTIQTLLYTCLIAPIGEELIFRGVILYYSNKTQISWLANLYQALLFGIYHGNMMQFTYTFILGLFLGFFALQTNSLKMSIFIHILFNSVSLLLPMLIYVPSGLPIFIYFLISILLLGLTYFISKKIK